MSRASLASGFGVDFIICERCRTTVKFNSRALILIPNNRSRGDEYRKSAMSAPLCRNGHGV